eukprot:s216_g12.t1
MPVTVAEVKAWCTHVASEAVRVQFAGSCLTDFKVLVEEHLACRLAVVQAPCDDGGSQNHELWADLDIRYSKQPWTQQATRLVRTPPGAMTSPAARGRSRALACFAMLAVMIQWHRPTAPAFSAPAPALGRRFALAAALAPALQPAVSWAQLTQVPDWQGSYEDPDHPGCKREVRVEGMKVTIDAAEGKPGCGNGEKEFM